MEENPWNLPQIFIMWVSTAEKVLKVRDKRLRSWRDQMHFAVEAYISMVWRRFSLVWNMYVLRPSFNMCDTDKDCQLITTIGHRRLRSSNVATCDLPRTRTTLGNRSFTAAGPHLWNNLPLHLCDFELSLSEFRRLLKTHLFGWRSRRLVTYF